MNQDKDELIHGYLDGLLNESQEAELNDWVKASPANASHFARIASLNNHLGDLIRAGGQPWAGPNPPLTEVTAPFSPAITKTRPFFRRIQLGWIGGIAALAAGLALVIWWGNPGQLSASGELNRLIETSSARVDRTYRIRNLDPQPEPMDERRPPIDGAMLHVRQPDQYVLIRKFPDGRQFLTGSDGEHSWSHPRNEVVRVSSNPLRFRGPVPGNQHGIPFVNLRSDLLQMRDAYQLTMLKPMGNGWRGIEAEKKSVEYRGPNKIELWYDPVTGVIHRMIFDGMPQARGGPNSVSVELLEQKDLGPEFFHHQSHHGKDTKVIEED